MQLIYFNLDINFIPTRCAALNYILHVNVLMSPVESALTDAASRITIEKDLMSKSILHTALILN